MIPKTLADKANKYVHDQADRDGDPKFKRGVGITIRPSGNILRYSTKTETPRKPFGAFALAYFDAKDKQREAKAQRQVKAFNQAAKRKHTVKPVRRQNAAQAMARIARAGQVSA